MTIGVFSLELHLPMARSLKDKRQVVKRLKQRLRSKLNVAVAETNDHGELWQRAGRLLSTTFSTRCHARLAYLSTSCSVSHPRRTCSTNTSSEFRSA